MNSPLKVTFVSAVNDRNILQKNLLASPCLADNSPHQIILQEWFTSASRAYNDALSRAANEIVVFIHQDVFLPKPWLESLAVSLRLLSERDPDWGVLGCWGVTTFAKGFGHVYTPGQGVIGKAFHHPEPVQTLDELVLIIRKSSQLRFDPELPGYHLYGTDLCLRASQAGMKSYAISAFCIHNSQQYFALPREFVQAYKHIKRVWRDSLPIHTSCTTISRTNAELYRMRIRAAISRAIHQTPARALRLSDPREIAITNPRSGTA
jgi:glycosyl transferase family 2